MRRRIKIRLCALAAGVVLVTAAGVSGPAKQPDSGPASRLDAWLNQDGPTTTATAIEPPAVNPLGGTDRFSRPDALPGVVVFSDGTMLAGRLYTTRDKNWEVWDRSRQRWRHIPPIAVLSVRAVVVEEEMEKEWRWKEMGSDEKVFTGRTKPTRRLAWKFHLIDDSYLTGAIKGQPLWVESGGKRHGPFVLHERSAGNYGQTLKDLVHVKHVVISRRAMEKARQGRKAHAG